MTITKPSSRSIRKVVGLFAMAYLCAAFQAVSAQDNGAGSGLTDDSYRIGAGDQLRVDVWNRPELTVNVPVRPDGKISTPLVEDVVAVGKTSTELAREIEQILAELIRTPRVTVIVLNSVGTFSSQVQVLGQVANPGPVPYRDELTLLNAVLEAGGLTPFAAGNRAKLTRIVDGEAVEQRIRLKRLLEKGDLSENTELRPGDVIFVPAAVF